MYVFVDENTRYNKNIVAGMESHYNNADGYALQQIFSKFSKQENTKKLVIMLSDGEPLARRYSSRPAREHVRKVVRKGLNSGIRVLSVALDNFYQEDMYFDVIPYKGVDTAVEISNWIRKYFTEESKQISF